MKKYLAAAAAFAVLGGSTSALAAGNTTSTSATETTTIIRPIASVKNADLAFGTIIRPSSGSGTVTLSAANARTLTGTGAFWLVSPASTVASFTISGEGGAAFTLSVDATDTMTNAGAGGGTLTVTTANDAGCTSACALSGAFGDIADGTMTFHVGGAFPIASNTATGVYTGTLNITATYN
jgi:hypothetical protein